MYTEELKHKISNIDSFWGYWAEEVDKGGEKVLQIYLLDQHCKKQVGAVSITHEAVMSTNYANFKELVPLKDKKQIHMLLCAYADTPKDEREPEKRYYIKRHGIEGLAKDEYLGIHKYKGKHSLHSEAARDSHGLKAVLDFVWTKKEFEKLPFAVKELVWNKELELVEVE